MPLLSEVLSLLRGLDVWVEVKGIEEYDAVLLRTLHPGPRPRRLRRALVRPSHRPAAR